MLSRLTSYLVLKRPQQQKKRSDSNLDVSGMTEPLSSSSSSPSSTENESQQKPSMKAEGARIAELHLQTTVIFIGMYLRFDCLSLHDKDFIPLMALLFYEVDLAGFTSWASMVSTVSIE